MKKAEKAWAFYDNEMYTDESGNTKSYVSDANLFSDIKEIYNPLPKTVDMMNALVNQQELTIDVNKEDEKENESENNPEDTKKQVLGRVWANNQMQNLKYQITMWMLLAQESVIELYKKDGEIIFQLHNVDNVETKYQGNDMVYCKIEGTTQGFDQSTHSFQEKDVTKEYFDVKGYRKIIETIDGEESEKDLMFEQIPVVEIETDYDISLMFNPIDRYNEIEAYLKNVFWITGDTIAAIEKADGSSQLDEPSKDKMKKSRGKDLKILNIPNGTIKFLEYSGNTAQLMQEKQAEIKENIAQDFPEYVLAKTLSKGDPSGDALKLKAMDVTSKVESFRSDLQEGLVEIDNLALSMLGKTSLDHSVGFGPILPDSISSLVEVLNKLDSMGFPTDFIVDKMASVSFVDDPEGLKKQIENEKSQEYNQIKDEMDQALKEDDS